MFLDTLDKLLGKLPLNGKKSKIGLLLIALAQLAGVSQPEAELVLSLAGGIIASIGQLHSIAKDILDKRKATL